MVTLQEDQKLLCLHALDDIVGLTEGRAPNRGGDPDEMFPIRPLRWGADKGTGP